MAAFVLVMIASPSMWGEVDAVAQPASTARDAVDATAAPGERALEGRLLAPCCWDQTLDIHESELARDLRHEIHARLRRGESAETVELDLVQRYGERLRAIPSPGPLKVVAVGILLDIGSAAIAIAFMLRTWSSRNAAGSSSALVAPATGRDAYDDRLDDELRDLDA